MKSSARHFLDSCNLCNKALNQNSDIFMYRGNTPFCSQECRQEQIEMDETMEKKLGLSSKRSSKKVKVRQSQTDYDTAKKSVRTGTVTVS